MAWLVEVFSLHFLVGIAKQSSFIVPGSILFLPPHALEKAKGATLESARFPHAPKEHASHYTKGNIFNKISNGKKSKAVSA